MMTFHFKQKPARFAHQETAFAGFDAFDAFFLATSAGGSASGTVAVRG
jgi:hypothetical protein